MKDNGGGEVLSIDPFQSSQWGNTAVTQCRRAGLGDIVHVVEEKSLLALPRLLAEGRRFEFVFIDGMHLFDYTLVDFFYADQLLDVGGVVCVDDARHVAVGCCIEYLKSNYIHFRFEETTLTSKTLATFVKVAPDGRGWDFHKDF